MSEATAEADNVSELYVQEAISRIEDKLESVYDFQRPAHELQQQTLRQILEHLQSSTKLRASAQTAVREFLSPLLFDRLDPICRNSLVWAQMLRANAEIRDDAAIIAAISRGIEAELQRKLLFPFAKQVQDHAGYVHDGRANSLTLGDYIRKLRDDRELIGFASAKGMDVTRLRNLLERLIRLRNAAIHGSKVSFEDAEFFWQTTFEKSNLFQIVNCQSA